MTKRLPKRSRVELERKDLLDLAGKENISLWHSCDAEGASLRYYRSLDAAAPGGKGVSLAIAASIRYASSRSLAWYGGVLSGSARYVVLGLERSLLCCSASNA